MSINNAITRRITALTRQWNIFVKNENALTAIWSVQEDEVDMIEAFYEVEKSEEGKTEDIFLKFETPFLNAKKYTNDLCNELEKIISDSKDDIEVAGIDPGKWITQKSNTQNPAAFLKRLNDFYQFLDLDGKIVAYLSPKKNTDITLWTDWLLQCNQLKTEQVKIMLVQLEDQPVFDALLKKVPQRCTAIVPELKMENAITELAAQGNPNSPDTKFRKLYVALIQAAGKSDLPETERLGREAIKLTRRYRMTLMEATIYMVLGGVYISHKKKKDGLINYDQAIKILENENEQPELAKQQLVVAHLSKGMALFIAKKYEIAAATYDQAGLIANQVENHFLAMDSWRMAGTSYSKAGFAKEAYQSLKKSLKVGMKIDEKMRRESTMPFAAMDLFKLEKAKGRIELDKLMKTAIGPDWQDLGSIKEQAKMMQE